MANGGDFAHLPPDMHAIAQLDAEARVAHIRAERWIQHAAVDRLLNDLQDVFDQPPRERMENLLLLGESGMGKTMLIRKFERQNAVNFDKAAGVRRRPVVVMLMPPQPTESEFFNRLLEAIDAPSAGYWAHGNQLRTSAIRLLREVGARVLVIDEINSVLAGTPRQQRLFLQLLRFLSNDLRLALVGVGVPEARHALLSDAQLRSRFSDVELPLWTPGEDLRDFVNRLVWSLPLRHPPSRAQSPSPVDSARLRAMLAERSGGITLGICKAVERAAVAAIRNGRERIELANFEAPEIWRGVAAPGRGGRPRARRTGEEPRV